MPTVRPCCAVAAALLVVLVAGCTEPAGPGPTSRSSSSGAATTSSSASHPPAQPVHLFFDFGGETAGPGDLSGWTAMADAPADPNNPGHAVAWNVTACDATGWEDHVHIRAHPVHSACFSLDGRQDDGTVWIERSISVVPGASYVANVSVRALGQESFNTIADIVVRLGETGAAHEADFAAGNGSHASAIRRPLDMAAGWTQYGLTWETGPVGSDHLVLDVGISAVWETEMTRYLDAVTMDLVPQG